ncbi:DUF2971 domain-containing protein [Akkermansia muciniphila]|uniref:DUF2971 domain-containing protein n=1 Tax=Akkermansia muciniphila TaxID=239935 RepID=UPI001BFFBBE8|nr:DUF2971 domain-containing protein [Akkermansia muciniphila]MBT8778777.1 DUF2971 domain-containing protein [Akkermansia muciniphila]
MKKQENCLNHTIIVPNENNGKKMLLYKYVNLYSLMQIIEHCDMKISFREDANDPYEMLEQGIYPGDVIGTYREYGFISLSRSNDVPSLWGNYADKYSGACIEIEMPYFRNEYVEGMMDDFGISMSNGYRGLCRFALERSNLAQQPQIYINKYRYFNEKDLRIYIGGGDFLVKCLYTGSERFKCDASVLPNDEMLIMFGTLGLKDYTWEYEQEYRVPVMKRAATRCSFSDDRIMYFSDTIMRFVKRIILGPKCKYSVEQINEYLQTHKGINNHNYFTDIKITQAKFSKTTFSLEIDD